MSKFKNYIFDLDGTIVNSSGEVMLCFKKAFKAANYKIDETRLNSNVIGPPLRDIVKLIAPDITEKEIDVVTNYFRQIYDFDENDISITYDGITELLHELKKENARIFMATYKPTVPTVRVLEKFGITNLFDDIYTIDKYGNKISKEDMIRNILDSYSLKKEETIIIGDAVTDVTAGKNTGVTAVGALWGYGDDKVDLIREADYCVKTVKDLKKWLGLNFQTI